ncbi:MAG: acetate--CoA ligase [Verrucomicrobiae bacterium]|nr:acetate--CoA ligase [Verrucomicrobiae bacterium]
MSQPVKNESTNISSMLKENRIFKPAAEFSKKAWISSMAQYKRMYNESIKNPEKFWGKLAKEELHWFKAWKKVLIWKEPFAQWFVGGKTNVSYNCLDRHLTTDRKNKAALIFEGEPGDSKTYTYQQLHREVCKFANVLKSLGFQKGDRAAIYMPMIPEAAIAMLGCARIGVTHSVVFGGFSAEALKDRINDQGAKLVITADGGFRRGSVVPLKKNVDDALKDTPTIQKSIVFKRCNNEIEMTQGRDVWWHEQMKGASADCPAEPLDAEHPLFILYTSGSTGKPKGVLHTTGGYLITAHITTKLVFDMKESDTFWCTADIGWVTGHSYVVYGPLSNGGTSVLYEGAPNWPNPDRFWEIIDKYSVSIFYTAPTAIRAFMKWGDEWPKKHKMDSLRLLGTVGEPINPEAWMWYRELIGHKKCPIVDTWWQTETGGMMITPLPGATPTKPGTATLPFFGIDAAVVDKQGKERGVDEGGFLVIRKPWPAMLRTIFGDDERYKRQYWSEIPGMYFAGDGARRDKDGYFWIMGRIDDVLNISAHRIGTSEVESILVSHPKVAEAAVVGRPDELTGQALVCFVTPRGGVAVSEDLKKELIGKIASDIGAFAKPKPADIRFTDTLPKTRSGKIMRRLLKELATSGEVKGDTTTLEDFGVLAKLRQDEA